MLLLPTPPCSVSSGWGAALAIDSIQIFGLGLSGVLLLFFHSCDYLIKYVVFLGVEANWWTWQQGVVCPLRWTEVSPVTGRLHSLSSWRLHFREGNGSSLENCVALCLRFWQSFAFPSAEPGLEAAQSSCVHSVQHEMNLLVVIRCPPCSPCK